MRLTIEAALNGLAHSLTHQVTPDLRDPFAIESARLAAIVATIAANTADDAVAIRVEEHASLRALFADAAKVVTDDGLADRLSEAARSHDPGLRIGQLDGETGRLRALLVELHAQIERRSDAAARAIDGRIWALLAAVEAARAPRG